MSNETTPVGQYTFRESALVQGMYQIVDGQGNCVGVLRDLSDAAMLCRHLNIALGQASRELLDTNLYNSAMKPEDRKTIIEALYDAANRCETRPNIDRALALLRAEPEAREPKTMTDDHYNILKERMIEEHRKYGDKLRFGHWAEIAARKVVSHLRDMGFLAPLDRSRMIEAVKDSEVLAACETYADNYMIEGRITTSPKAMRKALENFLKYRK